MYNEEQNPPSTDLFFPQHPLILISITNCLMVALVLVPTRELCLQVYGIAQQLVHRFHWIVPGYVMGGENRAKEKARLRKGISRLIKSFMESIVPVWCHALTLDICLGISILIATPGRLLDHLQHTASFVYSNLRWIVFDEADRSDSNSLLIWFRNKISCSMGTTFTTLMFVLMQHSRTWFWESSWGYSRALGFKEWSSWSK